jgi:hypothetical protein
MPACRSSIPHSFATRRARDRRTVAVHTAAAGQSPPEIRSAPSPGARLSCWRRCSLTSLSVALKPHPSDFTTTRDQQRRSSPPQASQGAGAPGLLPSGTFGSRRRLRILRHHLVHLGDRCAAAEQEHLGWKPSVSMVMATLGWHGDLHQDLQILAASLRASSTSNCTERQSERLASLDSIQTASTVKLKKRHLTEPCVMPPATHGPRTSLRTQARRRSTPVGCHLRTSAHR